MTTSQIVKANNRVLERRFIQSIGKHSESDLKPIEHHKESLKLVHDDIFDLPINELTKNQKSNLKNLMNEN